MHSSIRSRAGLVALIFTLIISFVSAVPIPIPALQSGPSSTLSSRSSSDGQDLIQRNTAGFVQIPLDHPISTLPIITGNAPIDADDQLVPRSKIGDFFKKIGNGIKHVAQKIGSGIKSVAQKVGSGIKNVAQKVGNGIKNVAQKVGSGIKNVAQKIGSGVKQVAQKVGSGIKKVAQKVGNGIKNVAQKVGSGIKKVAQKVGNGIKTAAQKVGHFVKTTGLTIAKFGLKVASVAEGVAGKVVGWIPGLKPVGRLMEGVSKVASFASDKIHAHLGSKLEEGMRVMDKTEKVLGYIPRDLSEENFQQRDAYSLERRYNIPFNHEEESYFDVDERDIYERAFDDYLDSDWD